MPAAVASFAEKKDFVEVRTIQKKILDASNYFCGVWLLYNTILSAIISERANLKNKRFNS